jgi:GTP-binding protein EngB required for normal cell division
MSDLEPGRSGGADPGRLAALARLAEAAGANLLAREATALAERVRDARFYVACVGEFKRGKSTLINALVGQPVLPTGVVPVTAVVTVVRYGDPAAARVRFGDDGWETCDPSELALYVSEEHNPGNQKGVAAVEVFVPSRLLASGMCLVDTPGIGSVQEANAAATRAFVPHIDAALVVLGADPPLSGEELALIQEIAGSVRDLILVLNKADRLPAAERDQAAAFAERVLVERLGRTVGPILQVSATERLAGGGPARDWDALVARLSSLARDAGADLVRAAEARGTAVLVARLLRDLDEQRRALLHPLEETQRRAEHLHRTAAEAEQALGDLGHRLDAVQERLVRAFTEARDRFFTAALPRAREELADALRAEPATGHVLRQRAIDHAVAIARGWLDRWRREQEPRAEALYREAMARFATLVRDFQDAVPGAPGPGAVAAAIPEVALSARSRFYLTEMATVAPASAWRRLGDLLCPAAVRRRAVERDARAYLERLIEVNSARLKNDFVERVLASRRRLEQEVRDQLRDLSASAARALEQARRAHAAGTAAVAARLEEIARLDKAVRALGPPEG